jgi:hypothetical protein
MPHAMGVGVKGLRAAALVLTLVILGGMVQPVAAQDQSDHSAVKPGWGLRAGMGLNPDQMVVGAQIGLNKLFKITRLVVSGDLGFFDNVTTLDFNGDLLIPFVIPDSKLGFYGGGGPTLALIDPSGGSSSWELGLSLVAGMRLPTNTKQDFNIETRFGIGDIPDFRLLLAIFF